MMTAPTTFLPNDTRAAYFGVSECTVNPKKLVRARKRHSNGAYGNEVEDLRKDERIDIGIKIELMPEQTHE